MEKPNVAVIGGTGMGDLFERHAQLEWLTYDSVRVALATYDGIPFFFLDRHRCMGGYRLPHQLDHAAYMRVLTETLGVRSILATSAVGGLRMSTRCALGTLAVPEDFRDFTGSVWTFATDAFVHPTAFHRPAVDYFCPHLRALLATRDMFPFVGGILAVAVRGPRYETPSEIRGFCTTHNMDHLVDFVGMPTAVPEAVLAREASAHYGLICCVTDFPDAVEHVSGEEVAAVMRAAQEPLTRILLTAAQALSDLDAALWDCPCAAQPSVFAILKEKGCSLSPSPTPA